MARHRWTCLLVNRPAQVLHVLHEINSTIGQAFCKLSMRKHTNELENNLVLSLIMMLIKDFISPGAAHLAGMPPPLKVHQWN